MMGEASDAAMREAKARAAEQVEKGKAVAAEAWNAAKPELAAQFDHTVDGERAGSADQATLVPSDQDTQPTGEGARREAAQRSE